jgi:hypothetical protein
VFGLVDISSVGVRVQRVCIRYSSRQTVAVRCASASGGGGALCLCFIRQPL